MKRATRLRILTKRYYGAHYWTVIVPWSNNPTVWHPTDRSFSPLSRGSFPTRQAAHAWAKTHLRGQPYSLRKFLGPSKAEASWNERGLKARGGKGFHP